MLLQQVQRVILGALQVGIEPVTFYKLVFTSDCFPVDFSVTSSLY